MADGSTRWELRVPDEVFDATSLASFVGAPLTLGHPSAVSPHSWARDAVGVVSAQPDRTRLHDGHDWLEVSVDINRADAISKVESGDLQELSVGYRADFDPTPGEFNGRKYDGIQRNIRANHIALLPRGNARAGREARLLTDSEEPLLLDALGNQLGEGELESLMHAYELASLHWRAQLPNDPNHMRTFELESMGRMPSFAAPAWLQEAASAAPVDPSAAERQRIQQEFEAELHGLHGKDRK